MQSATVMALGFLGDRVFQVVQNGKHCTPRDPSMASLFHLCCSLCSRTLTLSTSDKSVDGAGVPKFEVNLQGATKTVRVTCEGLSAAPREDDDRASLQDYGDEVAAWLERCLGISGARLAGIGSGVEYQRNIIVNPKHNDLVPEEHAPLSLADEAPFLLTTTASLSDLNRRLKDRGQAEVGMERFRPNIVITGDFLQSWEEDTWKRVRIGDVEFWVWQRCARCEMVTIDPDTLERGKEPLATLAVFRKRAHGALNFGMHLIPCSGQHLGEQGVRIAVGQELRVVEFDVDRRADWAARHAK